MESPRLAQDDQINLPTEASDHASNLVSEISAVDPAKISQDSNINNAKAIDQENSRIPSESSNDGQDLSETTKSGRKSTGEAEETQSQQAHQGKADEDEAEKAKSPVNEVVENISEIKEAEEAHDEINQVSEAQENISQENDKNEEINKPEPEIVQENTEAQNVEKEEPKNESDNVVQEVPEVQETNEVPEAEKTDVNINTNADTEAEVKEEEQVALVENTEPQNEEKPIDVVAENQVQEESSQVQEVSEPEPKVENIEEQPIIENKTEEVVVEIKVEDEPVVQAENQPEEVVVENKVEEQPVVQVENQPEEQNNNEVSPVVDEKKIEEKTEEVVEKKEEPVAEAGNQSEEQNNNEVAPVVDEKKAEEEQSEEVVEKKEEPVVEAETQPDDQQKNNEVAQVTEEAVQVEVTQSVQEEKVETIITEKKEEGIYTFPTEATQQENPSVTVEQPVKEQEVEKKPEDAPLSVTRSPKIKGLKLNITNNVMTRIINYDKTGQPVPDASVSEETKEASKEPSETNTSNSNGSPEVTKNYPNNQSLTDLLKPINMEEPQASPVIKRNATSTTCIANPAPEETKEVQQPNSAMIQSTQKHKLNMDDFQKITSIGRGSYGEVFLVKRIANGKLYALKSIDKNFMKKEKKEHQVFVEREVLMKLNHPNIIKIVSSFQDKTKLYFVLEYVSGGEFSDYLRVQGKLSKEQIVFFSAEIINILEYLHNFGIAHRDMKPENLLLTQDGHIKCIDFGTARFLNNEKRTADLFPVNKGEETLENNTSAQKRNHRSTFVGTAQYVSPEMLEGSDCGAPADLWALGCMIYLMSVGKFPFIDMNEFLIFQKIKAASVQYPEDMDPEIKDIIQKLLVKEPTQRLGAGEKDSGNDYSALKGHPLFKDVDFATLNEQKPPVVEIASPYKKKPSHDLNTSGPLAISQNPRKVNSEDLSQSQRPSQAFNFQSENQVKVILSGLVQKKCGWFFFKPRQLILNNKPRLMYFDPDSNQLKGEIHLAPSTKAELESQTKFVVNTPTKKFVFKEMEHSAEKWVEIINKTVELLYAKKPEQ